MRVVAGTLKGRKLFTPGKLPVRPTTDKVKGALFNILGQSCEGLYFLDLFAGSGAVGIEALSRGAREVVFAESDRKAQALLLKNLHHCRLDERSDQRVTLKKMDGRLAIEQLHREGKRFDILFFDPPYDTPLAEECMTLLNSFPLTNEETIIVIEHSSQKNLPSQFGEIARQRIKAYGDSSLSFYSR